MSLRRQFAMRLLFAAILFIIGLTLLLLFSAGALACGGDCPEPTKTPRADPTAPTPITRTPEPSATPTASATPEPTWTPWPTWTPYTGTPPWTPPTPTPIPQKPYCIPPGNQVHVLIEWQCQFLPVVADNATDPECNFPGCIPFGAEP